MQIECPNGCHNRDNWSYTRVKEDGHPYRLCDACRTEVFFGSEAEEEYLRYRRICNTRGAVIGVMVGTIIALFAKWLTR